MPIWPKYHGTPATFRVQLSDVTVVASKADATEKQGPTTSVSGSQINMLPSLSRSIQDMTRLSPSGNGISFGGANYRYNNLTIDGAGSNGWAQSLIETPHYVREKWITPLIQTGLRKEPDLPDTPLLLDLARNEEERAAFRFMSNAVEFGRPVATTPGAPAERLAALRPVQYEWRTEEFSERRFPTTTTSGLIAQEVERVLPELVTYDEQGYEGVAYHLLPVYNLQAIQELKAMNEALQALVIAQQTEVGELRKILTSLQRQMGTQVSKAVVSGQ